MSKAHCGGDGCEKHPYSSDDCGCNCERCTDTVTRLEIRLQERNERIKTLEGEVNDLKYKLECEQSVNQDYLQVCKQRDDAAQLLAEREEVIRKLKETIEGGVKVILEHELRGLVKPREPKYVFCLEHRRVMTENKCPVCVEKPGA